MPCRAPASTRSRQRGWRVCADASSRVGANPRGPLRACSLAVRAQLTSYIDEAGAPPALIVGLSGGADSLALALTFWRRVNRDKLQKLDTIRFS